MSEYTTPLILFGALAGDGYALYSIFEKQEVHFSINETSLGPFTPDGDPAVFWAIIAFHIAIGLAIITYIWMGWDPPANTDPD